MYSDKNKSHKIILFISFSLVVLVAGVWMQGSLVTQAQSILVKETEVKQTVLDWYSDSSIVKYLSVDTPFVDPNYIPSDLISIDSNFTANNPSKFKLRSEASVQFADMAWHFWNENNGAKLYVSSAYRSKDFQESMIKKGCGRARCALAGTSEHQAGLALDLKVVSSNGKHYSLNSGNVYYKRLWNHAKDWGFNNTYQKGIEVDGQMVEGRHRRYVGVGLANQLYNSGMTLAEYYKNQLITNNLVLRNDF